MNHIERSLDGDSVGGISNKIVFGHFMPPIDRGIFHIILAHFPRPIAGLR